MPQDKISLNKTKYLRSWKYSQSNAGVLIIMSFSWILRVFLLGAAPETAQAPIPHIYLATAMIPVLIAHLFGTRYFNLSVRKWSTLLMTVLWIVVAASSAFTGVWQPIYFGFIICYAWSFIRLARFLQPDRDEKNES